MNNRIHRNCYYLVNEANLRDMIPSPSLQRHISRVFYIHRRDWTMLSRFGKSLREYIFIVKSISMLSNMFYKNGGIQHNCNSIFRIQKGY